LTYAWILINWSKTFVLLIDGNLRKIKNPPQPTETEKQLLTSNSSNDKRLLSDLLSNILQNQLKNIQTPTNCSGPNFICGHYDSRSYESQELKIINFSRAHDFSRMWIRVSDSSSGGMSYDLIRLKYPFDSQRRRRLALFYEVE